MRKQILTAAVVTLATATTSFAADSVVPPAPDADNATIVPEVTDDATNEEQETVVRGQYRRTTMRSPKRQTVFSRLMELERRKNAWLRRTFLNR